MTVKELKTILAKYDDTSELYIGKLMFEDKAYLKELRQLEAKDLRSTVDKVNVIITY